MRHYITNRGEDCLIIYHPSRGAIARARIRRHCRMQVAIFRAACAELVERIIHSLRRV